MKSATYISSVVNFADLPKDKKPQIAMVGRSNVGKSSMINHLTSRKNLARVSSAPGRTQTMNVYDIDKRFYLVDLPGYGYARKSLEQREKFADMILSYLGEGPELKLVLLIIDSRIPPTDLDAEMLEWLEREEIPFVLVMNKVDKLKKAELLKFDQVISLKYPTAKRLVHSIDSDKARRDILAVIEEAIHVKK